MGGPNEFVAFLTLRCDPFILVPDKCSLSDDKSKHLRKCFTTQDFQVDLHWVVRVHEPIHMNLETHGKHVSDCLRLSPITFSLSSIITN